MMTVLIAPDKFKGSLTAREVVDRLARGQQPEGSPPMVSP